MIFREATINDIQQIHIVRITVMENVLSDPGLITENDYVEYMTVRGKGWVCEVRNKIVGFAVIDLKENNIWALFVTPHFSDKGIGKTLHRMMLDWYFEESDKKLWLGTAPKTRAETFYRKQGWKEVGLHGKEIKFEMSMELWKRMSGNNL